MIPQSLFSLDRLLNRRILELSFGEKKLVSIASILVHNPEIILLDEPTANLSPKKKKLIIRVLKDLRDKGKTIIILATHDIDFARNVADKLFLVKQGKVMLINLNENLEEIID